MKAVFPQSIVIVHLDNGFDNELYNWNLDILKNNGAKWDMIGMSLYPYWALNSGKETSAEKTITDCIANIKKVSEKYDCDVMIVETGMECADDNGKLAGDAVLAEGKALLEPAFWKNAAITRMDAAKVCFTGNPSVSQVSIGWVHLPKMVTLL